VLVTLAGLGALALQPSVGALAAGVMLGSVGAAAYGLWIVRHRYRLPTLFAHRPFDPSLRRSLARTAIRQAFPLWLATLMSLVYFKGDAVLLRLWAGDAAVGSYSVAFKLFEGTMILPSIVLAASFPSLVRAHDQVEARIDAEAPAHRRRAELGLGLGLLGLGGLVGAVLWATSATVIRLAFGPTFANAVPALRVLSLAIPLLFANYGLTHFLIARHLERYNLAFTIGLVILNLGSNWVLIPRWGALGAAWATLGTELALSVCCLVMLAERSPASSSPEPPRTPPPEPSATNKVRRSE
jgi:O-antigen/teichoic acid export membrane protein